MNACELFLSGARLAALPSGALFWPEQRLLCVSDLHLGKSERMARRGGAALPPYETRDTLDRLADALEITQARSVICLGDSFDDLAAAADLAQPDRLLLTRLQAGRRWIWIEGNHDPGPVEFGGSHMAEARIGPLIFRHIALPGATGEISGHFHPKVRVKTRVGSVTRAAFLMDSHRLILPAFGTYTGGLFSDHPAFAGLFGCDARAIVTGSQAWTVPMPGPGSQPAASNAG